MALRDELITTIVGVGMLRRDVATDIADAILKKFAVSYSSCKHERGQNILTEVGLARQCRDCGFQDFTVRT
jgi:Zn-finger domain-containing protein